MATIAGSIVSLRRWQRAFALLIGVCALAAHAQAQEFDFEGGGAFGGEDEFLKVDEAFVLSTTLVDDALKLRWDMPDGYYLYRHQFGVATDSKDLSFGPVDIPAGKAKHDEYFGDVEVYYHSADIAVPLGVEEGGAGRVSVTYQGCADAGLCYAPETKWFQTDGVSVVPAAPPEKAALMVAAQFPEMTVLAPSDASAAAPAPVANAATIQVDATEEQFLAGILADESLIYALALFFLAGIGLAFTPCVLPMVPILSSIIVGEGEGISQRKAFTLSFAYVLGMAVTYAAVGTLVGLFGAELNLQAALQSPPVLIFFAIVFVLLSLSMFGFYELQLPQSWQNRLNDLGQRQQGGKHLSVMFMGSLSSLVVSPCVSAPLAGALIYISTTNDAVLGGSALLALGLGMGVPLLLVGGSGGHWLPRAGAWMNGVKAVFGVGLLAVAVWLLERVVPPAVTLALWAALLVGSGIFLGVLDASPREGLAQFRKAIGAFSFLWGIIMLIGAGLGASDPLRPLQPLAQGSSGGFVPASGGAVQTAELEWIPVKSLDDVRLEISMSDKPVMLDLYADWCISCKTMERNVFPRPEVRAQLARFTLLKADVTDNDEIDQALLNHYGLFGPPSMVFFSLDGSEIAEVRLQGEIGADALARHLDTTVALWNERNVGEIASISR